MKSFLGILWVALLCGFCLPSAHGQGLGKGVGEYVITEKYDDILVKCAIAFIILAIIFLILLLLTIFCISRRMSDKATHKTYNLSYREREQQPRDISSPFYGHSIYARRTTSTIYLPGRETATLSTVIGTDGKPIKNAAYENEAAVMDVEGKRDSPPTEKGQKDSMVSEKRTTVKPVFDNSDYDDVDVGETSGRYQKTSTFKAVYDNSGYERAERRGGHDYETVDNTTLTRVTHLQDVRYTTTTVTSTDKDA